ncbi:MAG: hypothetical protein WC901_00785 [Candidatus Margulisiibacteriota bacterium]
MNIITRERSIKQKIDDIIADTSKENNKEVSEIILSIDELLRLSVELNRHPQEILDNGYGGINVYYSTYCYFMGAAIPTKSKKYPQNEPIIEECHMDKKWWQFWHRNR